MSRNKVDRQYPGEEEGRGRKAFDCLRHLTAGRKKSSKHKLMPRREHVSVHEQTAVYHDTSHHDTHLRTVAWITRYPKFRCIVQVTCSDSSSGPRTVGDSLVWLRSNATEWNVDDCPQIYSFAERRFWPAAQADSHSYRSRGFRR